MNLNPKRLCELLTQYRNSKHIPYTRIGEILGSKSDTVQGKSAHAKKAFEHPSELKLSQVQALADFMEHPVESLIFGDNNAITNIGDHNQNIVQTGSGNLLQTGRQDTEHIDDIEDIEIYEP